MSYETDFDSAFSILLGKAIGAITLTSVPITPTTGGTTTTTTVATTSSVEFLIDGGGSVISTGSQGGLILPFPILITKVELQEFEGTSGSVTVDIQAGVPGNSPTFASICASTKPAIASGRHYSDTALSGWTTAIDRGVALKYITSGVSTITRVLVVLFVRRTDV